MSRTREERAKAESLSEETRRWRNKFYGLPVAYKAAPNWNEEETEKKVQRDIKSLWASVNRARKVRKA